MNSELSELIAAARDMITQVGLFIDLDDRVEDPAEHDLADVLANLEDAVAAFSTTSIPVIGTIGECGRITLREPWPGDLRE